MNYPDPTEHVTHTIPNMYGKHGWHGSMHGVAWSCVDFTRTVLY